MFNFYSGERTTAKEWPRSLEIKGRVRLDAFEKFLQELSLSRSRAVMVSNVSFYDIAVYCYSKLIKRKTKCQMRVVMFSFSIFSLTNDFCFQG